MSKPSLHMPTTYSVDELIEQNKKYAESQYKPVPPLLEMFKNDAKTNAPHVVVVTCIDSRANPYEVLGVEPYQIIAIRNVSGRITPALTDIAALDAFFHINQIVIMHHNNCGATHITKEHGYNDVKTKHPHLTQEQLEHVRRYSPIRVDDDNALKADIETLKKCKFIRKEILENVVGLYLDVTTGLVSIVEG